LKQQKEKEKIHFKSKIMIGFINNVTPNATFHIERMTIVGEMD